MLPARSLQVAVTVMVDERWRHCSSCSWPGQCQKPARRLIPGRSSSRLTVTAVLFQPEGAF